MDVMEVQMSGGLILIVMLVSLIVGYLCNKSFNEINGEDAFQVWPGIIQALFTVMLLLNIPNPDLNKWFIVGLIGTIVSYVVAIILCYKAADENGAIDISDYAKAIASQILLPLGTAILFIVVVLLLISRKQKTKRK